MARAWMVPTTISYTGVEIIDIEPIGGPIPNYNFSKPDEEPNVHTGQMISYELSRREGKVRIVEKSTEIIPFDFYATYIVKLEAGTDTEEDRAVISSFLQMFNENIVLTTKPADPEPEIPVEPEPEEGSPEEGQGENLRMAIMAEPEPEAIVEAEPVVAKARATKNK